MSEPSLKKKLGALRRRIQFPFKKRRILRKIAQLKKVAPHGEALARALSEVVERRVEPGERDRIARIEALRADFPKLAPLPAGSLGPDSPTFDLASFGVKSSKPPIWDLLLFKLVRTLRPKVLLELGTCLGLSACYQSAALELNDEGRILTVEGYPAFAAIAKDNLRSAGMTRAEVRVGWHEEALPGLLKDMGLIDYIFLDGQHEDEPNWRLMQLLRPRLAPGAVVVVDDIRWSEDMERFWKRVCELPEVCISIDMKQVGLLVFDKPGPKSEHCEIPLHWLEKYPGSPWCSKG